jgi:hypothetical protein
VTPSVRIGDRWPSETTSFVDAGTGREVRRHTGARAHSYPLYYFVPSHTADGRYLVFHSERGGWVELYRLELASGEIAALTDGRTQDSGWAIWCVYRLRGIYNHLGALNQATGEVWWFDGDRILGTRVDSLARRVVRELPGRHPIGQSSFSRDGRLFAFIHADRELYQAALRERECLQNMGQFDWGRDHQEWRERVPCEISVIDTRTLEGRTVASLPFHVHHVLFASEDRLVVNHVRGENGMLSIGLDGSPPRQLRPRDEHGTVCHQVVTKGGIRYEAVRHDGRRRHNVLGRCGADGDGRLEVPIPDDAYVHTGFDPDGELAFYESDGAEHAIRCLHLDPDPARTRVETIRSLPAIPFGQRHQAHPFLSPDRRRLFFTELVDGFSQVSSVDARDLVDRGDSWSALAPR